MHKRNFRGLVCSMLLGDGCLHNGGVQRNKSNTINKYTGQPRLEDIFFCMNHSHKQKDYALWKASLIDTEMKNRKQNRKCTYSFSRKYDKIREKEYYGLYVKFRWADYFRHLYPKIYKTIIGSTKKQKDVQYLLNQVFSDLHTAIWLMDDGNEKRKKRYLKSGVIRYDNPFYRLFTFGYTFEQNQFIKTWFQIKYNVNPRIIMEKKRPEGKQCYIVFSPEDSRKLFLRLAEYFCQVESMRQKFWLSFERYGLS